ncbi:MAG TPA: hypothetical protein VIY55_02805 [Acetobacteraceae bacterium]|jgi:hypothetical protein
MSHESVIQALNDYALAVRLDLRANPSVAGDGTALELLLAPKFQALIETVLGQRLPLAPRVLPEYRKGGIGRPDLAFAREAQPARAFIELKQPATSLSPNRLRGHDADQFHRFSELPLWAFCNFHRIHLYARGDLKEEAVVLPAIALDPDSSDAQASRLIRRHDPGPFLAILEALALAGPIAPRDAREVAEALAHAARLTRRIVRDNVASAPHLSSLRFVLSSARRCLHTPLLVGTTRVTKMNYSPMPSRRHWHSGFSWPERRLAKRSVAMRIERFREASTRCSVRHYVR